MIKREMYISRIRDFINTDLVKILTGIRRSGKSVMLELIKEELVKQGISPSNFIHINFENLKNIELYDYIKLHEYILDKIKGIKGKAYLFLDEIQEVEAWQKCVNSLRVNSDTDIYVTGSNAKLLSGEFATFLAGRYVEFVIYPFSFSEFMDIYRSVTDEVSIKDVFKQYLKLGGMPFLANLKFDENSCKQYLQDIYNSVVLKDVIQRNNIRDVDLLQRVIAYMTANIGRTFSANSISKYLKSENRSVTGETVINYIKACEEAFLIYCVKRQDITGKKILAINAKYYIADHGLREAVYGGNNRDIEIVLENIVYLELLRRGKTVTVGKAEDDKEIDFIAEEAGEKAYYQVCYILADESTKKREFGAFDKINDNYPKVVLSMDEYDMSEKGYKHMNICDFLLGI